MTTVLAVQGDITTVEVDAIVNAANSSLMGGGGVDGAIHRAGGPAIVEECKRIIAESGPLATGRAVATTAGNLNASLVIHTVGPIYHQVTPERAEMLLGDCYRNSLDVASANGCRTVAFPNISTGVYGYPKPEAAAIASSTVKNWVAAHADQMDQIVFVCFDGENLALYQSLLG